MSNKDKIEALRQEYEGLKYSGDTKLEQTGIFLRVPRLHKVVFEGQDGNKVESPGIIADLGVSTLRVLSSGDISPGTIVTVYLELQTGEEISLNGKVQWSNEVAYLAHINGAVSYIQAIELVDLPEETKSLITAFLAYKENLPQVNMVDKILDMQS